MTTTKPYLVRAIRDWALDNDLTPQILVDATFNGVEVPDAYVKDGQIVLNIAERAVRLDELGNDWVRFSARFGGQPFPVNVPMEAIVAVFARENGQGIFFKEPDNSPDPGQDRSENAGPAAPTTDSKPRSHLKVVK